MKKLFLILSLAMLTFGLASCGNDEITVKEEEEKVEEEQKEVEYSYEFTKDSGILVTLENPINEIVNIDVLIEYYNEEEDLISEENTTLIAVHNLSSVKTQFKSIPEDSTSFVIKPTYSKSEVVESYSNILDVISTDTGRDISLSVNNFESVPISHVLIGVMFYDNGEVVAYSEVVLSDIPASNSSVVNVNYPMDVNGGVIYFDSVTTTANYAYNE